MLDTEGWEAGDVANKAMRPARVVLTGFRGTGKTMVGTRLADLLGYRFIDTDQELVARIGRSVAVFVREQGWPAFRKLEKELLTRLAWMNRVVIATGGGAILHEREWQDLRRESLVVWLQADVGTIEERLRRDHATASQRPSLGVGGRQDDVESILAEREPRYRAGSDLAIDTENRSPDEIALLIRQHVEGKENK